MDINLFDYYLPEELIAQEPSAIRDECRLMVVNKEKKTYEDKIFKNIYDYLNAGDVLVRNNTKVIPARLFATKDKTGAHVEVLLLKDLGSDTWECLCGNAKAIKVGTILHFKDDELIGECLEVKDEGIRLIKFKYQGIFLEVLDRIGTMPLPPYIHKACKNNDDYQTVYAKVEGSAAAPTAGFHFTNELLEKLQKKGVEIVDVTLNIGLGTFRPVKVQDTKDHVMHSETYEVSEEAAKRLNLAKKEGRRIIAVGTTAVRTLEANINKFGIGDFLPDLIFYLDVPVETSIKRLKELRENLDRMDFVSDDQIKKINAGYKIVLDLPNVYKINANREIEQIVEEIFSIIISRI